MSQNGTAILEPVELTDDFSVSRPALTPQERLQAFGQELAALCEKYGVRIQPYIKTYNTGQQIADVEFVAEK